MITSITSITPITPIIYTIISFTIIIVVIYYTKPKVLFNKNKLKEFGIGYGKSLLPFPIISIFIAILIYLIFFYIDKQNYKTIHNPIQNIQNIQPIQPITNTQSYIYRVVKQTPDGTLIL
jgi:hypothetical protein